MNKEILVGIGAIISFVTFMGILPTYFYYDTENVGVNTVASVSLAFTISCVVWWFIIIDKNKPKEDSSDYNV